jgi:hypothetical protein
LILASLLQESIYEYACHDGNDGLVNMLTARGQERRTNDSAGGIDEK